MKPENNQSITEIIEVAPYLAAAGNRMPFRVPPGYFEGFVSTVLSQVNANKANDVPEGYFDQFALQMVQKVRGNEVREELEGVSPLLNRLPKTMPHSLPEDYFEQWQPTVLKEKAQKPAKVISLGGTSRWKQWAAAAAILFIMGISWQLFVNKDEDTRATASVSATSVDTLFTGIDANSLTEYLEEEQANSAFASLLMAAQQDVETGVTQLSDEELKWYLDNQAVEIPGT
jgi:hypothetical protein